MRDDLFRTGRFAKSALHAQAFGEAQHRAVGIVRQRPRRAGGDTGMAERAALDIEIDAAERRARRQRHDIDRRGRGKMEFAKCGLEHAAFGAARDEAGGLLRRDANRRRIEHGAQLVGIVGLDDPHQACAEAERRNNAVRHLDRPAKPGNIVPGLGARHDRSAAAAIGEDRGDDLRSELRHLVDAQRQHIRRQSRAEPRQGVDDVLAVLAVVKQHDGVAAAGLAIGLQQRAQPPHQRVRARQRIGCRAGRAYGCAGAAAGADVFVDHDRIAVRRDRAGRAQIETARASGDAGARMGAERLLKMNKARLVERADQTAGIRDRAFDRGAVARIGAQISRTQFMRGKQRHAAAEIEDQVAGRGRAVARRPEHELCARGGRRQRVVVDRKLEGAEMSARIADRALEHRKLVGPARDHVARPGQQHGDVETVGEALGGLDCDLVAAIDQRDAVALQRHQRNRRHLLGRRGDQRRGLRAGRGRVVRPAAGFANVDKGELRLREILRDFPEQRGFLGAGDRDRRAVGQRLP